MFFTYLARELRRRRRQTLLVASGLALGIGLVVAVSAMADGVRAAQSSVLHSLYGVGTDLTVTRSARSQDPDVGFRVVGGGARKFSRDQIVSSPGRETFDTSRAERISGLDGVAEAAGGLSLSAIHLKGALPTAQSSGGSAVAQASPVVVTPGRINVSPTSIEGVDVGHPNVGPLTSDRLTRGRPFTAGDAHRAVAIVSTSYAGEHELGVGDPFRLGATTFKVVGVVSPTAQGTGSDVYLPLAEAQKIAGLKGEINIVYVKATSSSAIGTAKRSVARSFPHATVSSAADLAKQVSGSLSSATGLATRLGTWLSVAALLSAVLIASLLTLSAVGRRVREFGTLRALGWRTRRVVGHVLGESLVQGLVGGTLGIGVGAFGAWLVTRVAPSLTATVSALGGGGPVTGAGPAAAGPAAAPGRTISVALTAPLRPELVALAFGLSLAAGLVAGMVGGWRASRLRPADAMRRVV